MKMMQKITTIALVLQIAGATLLKSADEVAAIAAPRDPEAYVSKWKKFPGASMFVNATLKTSIAVSPDGSYLAAERTGKNSGGNRIQTLGLWDTFTWKQMPAIESTGKTGVTDLTFSPMIDGSNSKGYYLAADYVRGDCRVWKSGAWNLIHNFHNEREARSVFSHSFSRDGQRLALGLYDGTIEIRNMENGVLEHVLGEVGRKSINKVCFSPSSSYLASIDDSSSGIKIWNTDTGELVKTVNEPSRQYHVASIVFSPDGRYLAAGGTDGVYLYSAAQGEWRIKGLLRGRPDTYAGRSYIGKHYVGNVIFSADGNCVALHQGSFVCLLYKKDEGTWEYTYEIESNSERNGIAFSLDHHYLATTSPNKGLTIWNLDLIKKRLAKADSLIGSILDEGRGSDEVTKEIITSPDSVSLLRDFLIKAQMKGQRDPKEEERRRRLDVCNSPEYKSVISAIITNDELGGFLDGGPIKARLAAKLIKPEERESAHWLSSKIKGVGSRAISERVKSEQLKPKQGYLEGLWKWGSKPVPTEAGE
jgi:WD40 repeat protein